MEGFYQAKKNFNEQPKNSFIRLIWTMFKILKRTSRSWSHHQNWVQRVRSAAGPSWTHSVQVKTTTVPPWRSRGGEPEAVPVFNLLELWLNEICNPVQLPSLIDDCKFQPSSLGMVGSFNCFRIRQSPQHGIGTLTVHQHWWAEKQEGIFWIAWHWSATARCGPRPPPRWHCQTHSWCQRHTQTELLGGDTILFIAAEWKQDTRTPVF